MIALAGWLGCGAMMFAPFLINFWYGKMLAILGLALLTVQAVHNKMLNLVLLNVVGIIGYFWSLF